MSFLQYWGKVMMGNHKKNEKPCSNEYTWWGKRKNGFTLAELLIVVAIIAVLVAVAIPIFNSQLEKSRESTDLANIRAAYAEVMAETSSDGLDHKSELIALKQRINDWQNKSGEESLHSLAETVGKPRAEGQVWVEFKTENSQVIIHYGEPVPGDQATVDAMNFPEGSKERTILSSLADAERQALEKYKKENTKRVVGYIVTLDANGTPVLSEPKTNSQQFDSNHYDANTILQKGYFVAVVCDQNGVPKVGSNIRIMSNGKVQAEPYHIIQNKYDSRQDLIEFWRNDGQKYWGVDSFIY